MTHRSHPVVLQLRAQTRNWSHWISAGLALGRCAGLPPVLQALGGAPGLGTLGSWMVPALAGLGAYQTLSGATTISYQPAPTAGKLTVKEGEAFSLYATVSSTAHGTAQSYTISGDVPTGISPQEGSVSNGTILHFTGVPTQTGTFQINIRGWEKTGGRGESSPTYSLTLVVEASALPPQITSQPSDSHTNWGGTAQFTAAASNATLLRWRRNGQSLTAGGRISGAQTATLSLAEVTSADDGATFELVATGANGALAISQSVTLHVDATPYALWREQVFALADRFNDAVSGPTANPDTDTRTNALEFAFASDPLVADPADPFTRTIEAAQGDTRLRLTFAVNPAMDPANLVVESTADPANGGWSPLPGGQVDQTQADQWAVLVPLSSAPAFVRVRANVP